MNSDKNFHNQCECFRIMAEDVGAPLSELAGMGNMSAIAEDVCLGNSDQGIDVLGLVAIIIFYLAVLAVNTSHKITSSKGM